MTWKLDTLLNDLKFKGMAQILDQTLAKAQREAMPLEEVLHILFTHEFRFRQQRYLEYRIKQARLPWGWTLETFPFDQQPGVDKAQIRSLAGLDFITRAENLVFIGPPGTGKSGLSTAICRKALFNGYRARFYNAQDLLDELYASLADRTTSRLLKKLAAYDLLLIDELGYLSLKPEQTNAFFKLMEMRYSRKSTIITTNLDYPDWYDLFDRKQLVDALLDRLKHHCTTLKIDGPSLRVPNQKADVATDQPATNQED
jgi:DNA replication protein DnaC